MRDVYDVYQQVGFAHLVERRLEALHQVGRQLADKTDGVGQQEGQVVNGHLAHGGVERGKELVLGKDVTLRQQVHHRRLAHIGIAYQGHTYQPATVLALRGLLLVNILEALLEQGDAVQDDTTVHLQLCLARAAQSHTALAATRTGAAALAFQVGPQALQSGQHIAILRQLHLRLGLGRLGTHGKDVEDERCPVQYLHLQFLLYITDLLGREFVVKDDHTHRLGGLTTILRFGRTGVQPVVVGILLLLDVLSDFVQFAFADIRHLTGTLYFLREALDGNSPRRIGQELQLVQVFFCLGLVLLLRDESHQHSRLGFSLRNHKFLHSNQFMAAKVQKNIYSLFIIWRKFVPLQPIRQKTLYF